MHNLRQSIGKAFAEGAWPLWEGLAHEELAFPEFWDQLEESLITLVYGSNNIETAGSDFRITACLCQDVFHGRPVNIEIEEGDPAYQQHLQALAKTGRKGTRENVVQSRREVVQHARALSFMIDRIVLNSEPWSEHLILQTHQILYDGLGDNDTKPGKYREHEVAVSYGKAGETKSKRSICMRASAVPGYMGSFISNLNAETAAATAEENGGIDAYALAARYHHQFVMIHPFGDGNGRMTRIILNVLLLKYAGHVVPIGGDDDKDDYLSVVTRGREIFDREDMEVEFFNQTSHLETAEFILTKSRANLERMRASVSGK